MGGSPPLSITIAPSPDQQRLGRIGQAHGLYVDCDIDGVPVRALVDTGSTISIIRPGVLPNTDQPTPPGWVATKTRIATVTGEQASMRGRKALTVSIAGRTVQHWFWLANIQDKSIIGLDLLTLWGATVNIKDSQLHIGRVTVSLRAVGEESTTRSAAAVSAGPAARSSSAVRQPKAGSPRQGPLHQQHAPPSPGQSPPTATAEPGSGRTTSRRKQNNAGPSSFNTTTPQPSEETRQAVQDLCARSEEGLLPAQKLRLRQLLQGFIDIFAARDEECVGTRLVQHDINTGNAHPIRLRPRRLPLAKREAAEQQIAEMAAAGVIEPSNSPWTAPAVLVRKKDQSWRFCVDYRRLNDVTRKDSYPLPRIDDALDDIAGSRLFSSLDLRSGYWQVHLTAEARAKTAFSIGQGLWQFRVLPFGLCNGPATFERLMERVLAGVPRSRCVVFLDDLLSHAADFEGAMANLQEVFEAIRTAGLRLHPRKCHLLRRQTAFLGHIVSEAGVSTDPGKVAAVRDWPTPHNVAELRSFLGLASYYRRFVKGFADIATPLHRLTQKAQPFDWSADCANSFNRLRAALVEAPVLAFPDPTRSFILDTDASDVGVGAVLSQKGEHGEQVIGYFSRALSRPERNYCVTRRELLALVLGIKNFRTYLYGKKFLLRTDHAALTWLLNFREPEGQLARWLETLQDYDFNIQHRAGKLHGNADALSRRPCVTTECRQCERHEKKSTATAETTHDQHPREADVRTANTADAAPATDNEWEVFDRQQLQQMQEQDPVLTRLRSWVGEGQRPPWSAVSALDPETKTLYSQWPNFTIREGLLYRRWQKPSGQRETLQLLVPPCVRGQVLRMNHGAVGTGHFGISKTLHRLRSRFYWPGCRLDTEQYVHCCDACTARKGPGRRSHAPLQQYQVGAPMERVGVDFLGPFPVTERNNRYILVAMDYFTKWPEAYATSDQSAATTAKFLVNEMFSRFGAPEELHSDQGRNFEAEVFQDVCRLLGVKKTRTTPLHPQSDGLVERFNKTLAEQLTITGNRQADWDLHIPMVLWAYRSAVQESTGCTPAALMFGHELRTPVDLAFGPPPEPAVEGAAGLSYYYLLRDQLRKAHELNREALHTAGTRQKRAYDNRSTGQNFATGDQVWVYSPQRKRGMCPKLSSKWIGPCVVLDKLSDVVYRVQLTGRRRTVVLHRDRLAPYRPLARLSGEIETVGESSTGTVTPPPAMRTPSNHSGRTRRAPARLQDFVMQAWVHEDM